jgi:4-hydroxy-2-oxoheptanedioate aldolase
MTDRHEDEMLQARWASGQPTLGAWLTVPSPVSAEAVARVGFDYVCTDTQHGAIDYQATVHTIQAVVLGGSRPIVRVPWNEPGIIGKMLDAGAEAIVVPMVNTAAQARAVVRACRYPPLGERSFGPVMASLRRASYAVEANERVAVIPMIETAEAIANLEDILATPGLNAVYVGPADLSLSLGLPPGNNDGKPGFDEALTRIVKVCRDAGVVPGIHSNAALVPRRLEQGFLMVTVASDLLSMRTRMAEELAEARGDRTLGSDSAVY